MNYEKHNCTGAHKKDIQVPICPLCELPVPTPRNQKPDIAVSHHIDNGCSRVEVSRSRKKVKISVALLPIVSIFMSLFKTSYM